MLRIALLCFCSICNIQNASKEEKNSLSEELDIIMKNKLKELNSDFSDEVLSNMIESYYRGDGYCWINVYINSKYADIGRSLKYQQECDIKFCIQAYDDIILYTVHQSFDGDKPIWVVVNENRDVWGLTEVASKNKS